MIAGNTILFSGPMIRALLSGQKTQTRRLVKLNGHDGVQADHAPWRLVHGPRPGHKKPCWAWQHTKTISRVITEPCPYGVPGDLLRVRETWAAGACADGLSPSELYAPTWLKDNGGLWYRADETQHPGLVSPRGRWRPSIHMPKWASRISLEIVSIRVERLQEISEDDACAEGTREPSVAALIGGGDVTERRVFSRLWEKINGKGSWESNPWVWALTFKRVKGGVW